MKIIAFSGKKQSGKTTATTGLARRDIPVCYYHNFADQLKIFVQSLFVPVEFNVFREEFKDKILASGKTIRETLQWFGTDICRNEDPDCWINAYKKRLSEMFDKNEPNAVVLTGDVRFPNEVACVQSLGGHVIRLLRAPFPDDKHESETALDEMEKIGRETRKEIMAQRNPLYSLVWTPTDGFDAIIDNKNMDIPTQNEAVWKLVKEKKWV